MSENEIERETGMVVGMAPGIRRLIAPNPSPMTHWGTNTYLVGGADLAVIDPGPDDPAHLAALLAAIGPDRHVSHIVVTHSHLDHSPLAGRLSEICDAPVLAFGDSFSGRSDLMAELAAAGNLGGGEGVDAGFRPDQRLGDGDIVTGTGWTLTALHTPGHFGNHIALAAPGGVFVGDHVMGWASSLVSPPDGDLGAFMRSCTRLRAREDARYFPGHGDPVDDPAARLDWLITHRRRREAAIIAALRAGHHKISDVTEAVYTDTPPALRAAAARNVFAHLIDLSERGIARTDGAITPDALFRPA